MKVDDGIRPFFRQYEKNEWFGQGAKGAGNDEYAKGCYPDVFAVDVD